MSKYGFWLMLAMWIVSGIVSIICYDSSTLVIPGVITAAYGYAAYHD